MRGTPIRSASFLAFPCQIHKEAATEMLFSNPCKKNTREGWHWRKGYSRAVALSHGSHIAAEYCIFSTFAIGRGAWCV